MGSFDLIMNICAVLQVFVLLVCVSVLQGGYVKGGAGAGAGAVNLGGAVYGARRREYKVGHKKASFDYGQQAYHDIESNVQKAKLRVDTVNQARSFYNKPKY